ncbi:QueT transporter family protein [Anoxynatronum sibiricum]|uniref:QueT transporter family protein n=1 Tax=Anoxynatronum sibiricum TaxID=210623 RepID=A0ABU9VT63_9CLOT
MKVQAVKKSNAFADTRSLTFSAIVIALYVVIMFFTQSFAFGQYQVRIATSLYALAAINPVLIIPLGAANFLSNTILGGLGPMDMIGGFMVGIFTAAGCRYARKVHLLLVALPIMAIPTLMVPLWLSPLINVPYGILAVSIGVGQVIPGMVGVLMVKYLEGPLSDR